MDSKIRNVLGLLALDEYVENFKAHEVGYEELQELDSDLVKELVPKVGHRVRLLKYLKELDEVTSNSSTVNLSRSNSNIDADYPQTSTPKNVSTTKSNSFTSTPKSMSRYTEDSRECYFAKSSLNFKDFLMSKKIGRAILDNYKETKLLSQQNRLHLIHLVADDLLESFDSISNVALSSITDSIIGAFPSESKGTYFIPPEGGRKASGGRLIERFRNGRRILTSSINKTTVKTKPSNDEAEAISWLKHSCDPWNQVVEYWRMTHHIRSMELDNSIAEYFKQYPALSMPMGFSLLEQDYFAAFPDNNGLLLHYERSTNKLWDVLQKKGNIKATGSYDNPGHPCGDKDLMLFRALSSFFPSPAVGKGPKRYKPSSSECENGFILVVEDKADIKNRLRQRDEFNRSLEVTSQPIIIAVTSSSGPVEAVSVHINSVTYETNGIVKAVDMCFKIHMALDAEYSPEARSAYLFIQKYFYEISTSHDKMTSSISALIDTMNREIETTA